MPRDHQISERLRQAIDSWQEGGGSIRKFQRAIRPVCEEREVKGSSYAMIHRYLANTAVPSVEFLRVAAELLGVRESWLISGQGGRTEGQETARQLAGHNDEPGRVWPPEVQTLFDSTVEKLVAACPDSAEVTSIDVKRLATLVLKLTFQPLEAVHPRGQLYRQVAPFSTFGIGVYVEPRHAETHTDYYIGILSAIRMAIPEPGRGRSVSELLQMAEKRNTG